MSILTAILGVIKAIPVVDSWFRQLVMAYLQTQKTETLRAIADAAALESRAQTDDDRYKAAQAWQSALSRPRITS